MKVREVSAMEWWKSQKQYLPNQSKPTCRAGQRARTIPQTRVPGWYISKDDWLEPDKSGRGHGGALTEKPSGQRLRTQWRKSRSCGQEIAGGLQ